MPVTNRHQQRMRRHSGDAHYDSVPAAPRSTGLAAAFALCLAWVLAAAADAPYKDHGDRMEGVPAHDRGGAFHLFGVHVDVRPSPFHPATPKLYLSFPLAAETELEVKVWEDDKGYLMVPHRTSFQSSEPFSWPRAAVLEGLKIDPHRLGVLATGSGGVYYPARLSSRPAGAAARGYAFVFFSPGGVEVTVEIAREEQDGTLTPIQTSQQVEDFGGYLPFRWNGKDAAGKPVASGVYHLLLAGKGFAAQSFKVKTDVPFMHLPRP